MSDEDLVLGLQLEASSVVNGAFSGLLWLHVYEYGLNVLIAKILDGGVWALYRRLVGHLPRDLETIASVSRDDAYDLAAEVVVAAVPILREQIVTGRWSPTGGASIRTWFVSLAILRLPGPWRAWRKHSVAHLPARSTDAPDHGAPTDAIIYTLEFERQIELLDDELSQVIVRLDCAGLTDGEIAEAIGRTVKSTEYQLAKARGTLRKRARLEMARDARSNDVA